MPVGSPVGDPPGGSSLTARLAAAASAANCVALRRRTLWPEAGNTPRETGGADPAASAQSSCAPLAGTLKAGAVPVAGQAVQAGKPVLQLAPVLDPVGRANLTASRVDAEGQVRTADEQLKIARITLERAKEVLAGGGGRQRDVDDANAAVRARRSADDPERVHIETHHEKRSRSHVAERVRKTITEAGCHDPDPFPRGCAGSPRAPS